MSTPLADYALLSDLRTGPLVSRDGSVDWLCLPRFDSPAIFSALFGDADDGRRQLSARDGEVVERRYLPQTLVLETTWRPPPERSGSPTSCRRAPRRPISRRVECLEGTVEVEHDLRLRFNYARATPWIGPLEKQGPSVLLSLAGPDGLLIGGPLLDSLASGQEDDDGSDA
jgi:GH15 family glucan-1,4-alpha-glucosidase